MITPTDEEILTAKNKKYRQMVGSLLYAATNTRPDIAQAVAYASRFNRAWGPAQVKNVKRIFAYLKGTADYGITYGGEVANNQKVVAYSDSDWAVCPLTRKSTTGYVILLCNGAVIWYSKIQPCISLSSTEAEYVALRFTFAAIKALTILLLGVSPMVG